MINLQTISELRIMMNMFVYPSHNSELMNELQEAFRGKAVSFVYDANSRMISIGFNSAIDSSYLDTVKKIFMEFFSSNTVKNIMLEKGSTELFGNYLETVQQWENLYTCDYLYNCTVIRISTDVNFINIML